MAESTFELKRQYEEWLFAIEDNHGEVTEDNESTLSALMEQVEDKGQAVYYMVKKCEGMIAECKIIEDDHKAQREKWTKKKEKVKGYLKDLLLIKGESETKPKFVGPWGSAFLSKRKSVQIFDPELVIKQFFKEETVRKIDKTALKNHLKENEECEGAALVETVSVSIRSR